MRAISMQQLYLLVALAPLAGAIVVGLFGSKLGRTASHWICILGVAISFVGSVIVLRDVRLGHVFNGDLYVWMTSGNIKFAIGFLIDPLTALMMAVVTFVSLMVHIYTIGYMADDAGYTRFSSSAGKRSVSSRTCLSVSGSPVPPRSTRT
jgi:NADH-quinone oxidoreductase subunit L